MGTKTNNLDTLGDDSGAKDVGSAYMASGFHLVGCKEPLGILSRSHMTQVTPGERSALWHSQVDLPAGGPMAQNSGSANRDGEEEARFSKDVSKEQVRGLLGLLNTGAKE